MLLGFVFTAVMAVSSLSFIFLLFMDRRELHSFLSYRINKYSLAVLVILIAFFLYFSVFLMFPNEQLYFDENIYQGIALNILHHWNSLWCQSGTGYLNQCFNNSIYHDPAGWSFFIAIAFGIFGVGAQTAYALQLFAGVLSIIGIFFLASALFDRHEIAVLSTAAFALMPLLFIWSRTQANIDQPFMMFSIFTFFFFAFFLKKPNMKTFGIFASLLTITIYMRIEAILLMPIFLIAYLFSGTGRTSISKKVKPIVKLLDRNTKAIAIFFLFVLLILPEIFYIATEFKTGDYNQPASQPIFSIANLISNSKTNIRFLLGSYNQMNYYPAVFPKWITILAIVGLILFAFDRKFKNRRVAILMLSLWFLAYFIFYGAFYAGSALYGVDSRFMLELAPSLAVLAGIAIYEIGSLFRISKNGTLKYLAMAFLVMVFVAYPFATLVPVFRLTPQQMPQQGLIYPSANFIYNNYTKVPSSCLVFTFTPDVWYMLNRSAAQISYLGTNQSNLTRYRCAILDYGYWCTIVYHNTVCQADLNKYATRALATQSTITGNNVTIYQILNYTG